MQKGARGAATKTKTHRRRTPPPPTNVLEKWRTEGSEDADEASDKNDRCKKYFEDKSQLVFLVYELVE